MSKYKEIKGFKVQTLASDTAASVVATGTWASGGSLNTAVNASGASNAGTQTASINFAGNANPYPTVTAAAESYNGTSWGPISSMGTARWILSSFGTQTAAVGVSGVTDVNAVLPTTAVEQWNGTSWTEVAELTTNRHAAGGFGTTTAGLIVGGQSRPGSPPGTPVTYRANVEAWNGTAWTETTDINTARDTMFSFGINTSGLIANGQTPTLVSNAESWNGSSWTEVAESNTTRYSGGAAGSSNTLGLIFGGYGPSYSSQTESWDGTSWTELNNLANTVANLKGSGSVTSALAYAGTTGSASAATEEWTTTPAPTFSKINLGQVYYNSGSNAFKVTQTSAADGSWASITSGNTARRVASGVGTSVSNGMVIAGYPQENEVETWNGTSWTEVAEVNSARGSAGASSNSPNSSALFFGGDARPSGPETSALNESWNGSAWTEVGDLPAGLNGHGGAGVSNTSALSYGGSTPSATGATNEWNGSSWTSGGAMNTARYYLTGTGTTTSALALGGFTTPPSVIRTNAEAYDGSSWTNLSATNSGHSFAGASGNTTEALLFGGEGPSYPGGAMTQTEYWDGTSWTEVADLSAGNLSPAGFGGSGVSAISSFGNGPSGLFATAEEFAAGTSNKTITVS